jgi:hypothetical protein
MEFAQYILHFAQRVVHLVVCGPSNSRLPVALQYAIPSLGPSSCCRWGCGWQCFFFLNTVYPTLPVELILDCGHSAVPFLRHLGLSHQWLWPFAALTIFGYGDHALYLLNVCQCFNFLAVSAPFLTQSSEKNVVIVLLPAQRVLITEVVFLEVLDPAGHLSFHIPETRELG